MEYETAQEILIRHQFFPECEEGQRDIIRIGTPRGVVRARAPGARLNFQDCPPRQAYRVAERLYSEAKRVKEKTESELFRDINKEEVDPIVQFLEQTNTKSIDEWGGIEGVESYINPQ